MEKALQQEQAIWDILESVPDPEIPVLSVVDLGIIRKVESGNPTKVTITPTYSGCPAMDMIETQIIKALRTAGYDTIEVCTVLSPAWTTDWLSEVGKEKLRKYGIAPPVGKTTDKRVLMNEFPTSPVHAADRLIPN